MLFNDGGVGYILKDLAVPIFNKTHFNIRLKSYFVYKTKGWETLIEIKVYRFIWNIYLVSLLMQDNGSRFPVFDSLQLDLSSDPLS